ncbi:MAG: hypothetical protein EOR92_32045 [Mesorhizobium sp.]|nr:MAG: hypothetical protein EOR92_32045 [Mesorhizobium sp.]
MVIGEPNDVRVKRTGGGWVVHIVEDGDAGHCAISRKPAVPEGAAGLLLSKLECQQLREA